MRVVITGADGFVGSNAVDWLCSYTDWDLVPVGRKTDLSTPWPDLGVVDAVLSIASSATPALMEENPSAAVLNNAQIAVHAVDFARKTGAHLVHVSTNEVYGTGYHATTVSPLAPRGTYATSKACQETIIGTLCDRSLIVNTQNIFGPGQQPNRLIPVMINAARNGGTVKLQDAARAWLHVDDLVSAMHLAVCRRRTGKVHIVGDEEIKHTALAKYINSHAGGKMKVKMVATADRPGHEASTTMVSQFYPDWRAESFYDRLDEVLL